MRKTSRKAILLGAAVGAIGSLVPSFVHASTWTWIGSGGSAATPKTGSWNTIANWSSAGSNVPQSATSSALLFGGSGSTPYTATDNQAALQMGTITLNSSATVQETIATTGSGIVNASGGGASVTIEQKNTGSFSIALPIQIKNFPLILTSSAANPGLVTLSGTINGSSGGMSISMSSGLYQMTNTNNVINGTTIDGGILRITATSVLGGGAATVNSGGVLGLDNDFNANASISSTSTGIVALNANNTTLTGLGGSSAFLGSLGNFTFTPSGAYAAGSGSTYRLGGGGGTLTISGANKLTGASSVLIGSSQTNGSGVVVLSSTNNYTGTTTIAAGTLQIGVNNALPTGGSVSLTGGTLTLNNFNQTVGTLSGTSNINLGSGSLTIGATSGIYSGVISGASGNLVKQGTGVATLSGANSYSGTTLISAGTLAIGANDTLPTNGTVSLTGGTLAFNNFNQTVGTLSGTSSITLGSGSLTISATSGAFSGVISGASGNFVKQGTGGATLSGANTYTGITTVTNGTLTLAAASSNNIASSSRIALTTSSSNLDVTGLTGGGITLASSVDQTISGNGTVYGAVAASAAHNMTIAPGNSIGQLTFANAGDITLNTNATYEAEIGAPTTPGTTYDQILISSEPAKTLNIGGAVLKLLPSAGIVTGQAYTIVATSGAGASINFSSVFRNLDNAPLAEGPTYTQGPMQFSIDYDSTFVKVTFTTVPEPTSLGLVLLGTPALLGRRRRRHRR